MRSGSCAWITSFLGRSSRRKAANILLCRTTRYSENPRTSFQDYGAGLDGRAEYVGYLRVTPYTANYGEAIEQRLRRCSRHSCEYQRIQKHSLWGVFLYQGTPYSRALCLCCYIHLSVVDILLKEYTYRFLFIAILKIITYEKATRCAVGLFRVAQYELGLLFALSSGESLSALTRVDMFDY